MTHVHDLARYLTKQGDFVVLAFRRVNFLQESDQEVLLEALGDIPYVLYDTEAELRRLVLEHGCTLIHAHSHATFDDATEVALSLDIPLIVTLHSVFPWTRRYRTTLQAARRIIAVGQAQARSARSFSRRIVVIQNGVDTNYFRPRACAEPKNKVIHVLWYGRVDGRLARGLRVLDQIAPLLPPTIKIRALGISHPKPQRIPLLPWTNHPLPYLQESHITLAHGRSLREAMSSGSVGLLLGHGYGGRVTEERLTESGLVLDAFPEYSLPRPRACRLLREIVQLAEDPKLEGLRQEAREIALRHFDLKQMGDLIRALYCQVLRGK